MGTTIRREPVTTSIPAAPDYRFLNITNFGGIEKSSNPFVVSSNTASDCLNVYVDEDNALSTRPRLQFIQNLLIAYEDTGSAFNKLADVLGVHSLHDGYLLHVRENDHYYIHRLIVTNDFVISGVKISTSDTDLTDKIKVFEQDNNIYILTGNGYKTIVDGVLKDVEGYIPTTRIGKNKRIVVEQNDGTVVTEYDIEGSAYESPNLLTDKYKESYFWDNIVSPLTKSENTLEIENNYFVWDNYKNLPEGKIVKTYADGTFLFIADDSATYPNVMYCTVDELKVLNMYDTELEASLVDTFVTDGHNNHFSNNKYCVVKSSSMALSIYHLGDKFKFTHQLTITTPTTIYTGGISSTAQYVWFSHGSGVASDKMNVLYSYDAKHATAKQLTLSGEWWDQFKDTFAMIDVLWSDDDSKVLSHVHHNPSDDSFGGIVELTFTQDAVTAQSLSLLDAHTVPMPRCVRMSPDGKYVIAGSYAGYIFDTADLNVQNFILREKIDQNYKPGDTSYIDVTIPYITDNYVVWIKNDDNSFWMAHDLDNIQNITGLYTQHKTSNVYDDVISTMTDTKIILRSGEVGYIQASTEPLVIYTKKYTINDDERLRLSEIFKKAKLTQRFDNNTWFAADNYTFHTLYNNPAYVPLSSYNDLGETYEEITGLSIVNDNIMAAYKRNRIYIITPITIGDQLTYTYTETKNIIGNDVLDAPTLTILTEMPILVSYNGIYALNQLENVQSSDRITTLISESINPTWLKESQNDVDKCLVLNRLYWTYFILPHKKVPNGLIKDSDYTKIYLLDNRTQSWFYWELPIYVVSALVKENKTHFVTQDGNLYTLEITDIVNKFNKELTEYYDVLKQPTVIPWHWTSQILSLNTINYSKRLVDTTFVLTDTDSSDEYALNYKFKAFRKNKNAETTELTLTNDIEYVESITKRTMIPRFNFIQFTLSNTEDDQKLNNNKLRLVGLGLKYVLLGGLY